MTKFELPSFNSGANSNKYRDNYDSVFGKKKKKEPVPEPETGESAVEEIVIEDENKDK